jgi:hypothetical protein
MQINFVENDQFIIIPDCNQVISRKNEEAVGGLEAFEFVQVDLLKLNLLYSLGILHIKHIKGHQFGQI